MPKSIKLVVVGDGAVGKTCLLWSYANQSIPPEYVPTVFDNYSAKVHVDGEDVTLQLWDTAGQEELENIRVLSYSNTNTFLMCFAVSEPTSYTNIKSKWLVELKQHVLEPVILLVGTKVDLRKDESIIKQLKQQNQAPITTEQGQQLAQEIGAAGYLECSAITQEGIKQVFDKAILTALHPPKAKKVCDLL